jgi:hypothetical protein
MPHRPRRLQSEQNKKLSCEISFFSKPKANADNQSRLMRVFPFGASECGAVAQMPALLNPYIWGKFALKFIAQPDPQFDLVNPRANAKLAIILGCQIYLSARLQNKLLGDPLVKLSFDARGKIPTMR